MVELSRRQVFEEQAAHFHAVYTDKSVDHEDLAV
jgi:hypothetical protein